MKVSFAATAALVTIIALGVVGCGGGGGPSVQSDLSSYLPMALGNSWTYDLRISTVIPEDNLKALFVPQGVKAGWYEFEQVETITGTAQLVGTDYFVFETKRVAVGDFPERLYGQFRRFDRDGVYVRLGAEGEDVPQLATPPRVGETWSDPDAPNVTYEVLAIAEDVTVPAGTFSCVKVRLSDPDLTSADGLYQFFRLDVWFARGVGIVKDQTREQNVLSEQWEVTSELELRAYTIL